MAVGRALALLLTLPGGRSLRVTAARHEVVPALQRGKSFLRGASSQNLALPERLRHIHAGVTALLERLSSPQAEPAILVALARTALELRRADLALRFADAGRDRDPASAEIHETRGLALALLERPAEARSELEEACHLDPKSASARLNLAVLEAQEGRFVEAEARAREALNLDPDYPQAHALLERLRSSRAPQ